MPRYCQTDRMLVRPGANAIATAVTMQPDATAPVSLFRPLTEACTVALPGAQHLEREEETSSASTG